MSRRIDYRASGRQIPKVRSFAESMNSKEEVSNEMLKEIRRDLNPNRTVRPNRYHMENTEFNIPMNESAVTPEPTEVKSTIVGSNIAWEPCKIDPEVRPDKIFSQSETKWNQPSELGPSSEETPFLDSLNAIFNSHKVCINLNKSCCENLNKFYNG